jgi:hypothetical protein
MTRGEGNGNMPSMQSPFWSTVMSAILLCLPTGRALAGVTEAHVPPLVIAHWMPQVPLERFNHHEWSRDLPLIGPMQFRGDPVQQMREAKAYGIDVFAVCGSENLQWNSNMWRHSLEAADQVEGFYVIPCLCTGLPEEGADPGVKLPYSASGGSSSPRAIAPRFGSTTSLSSMGLAGRKPRGRPCGHSGRRSRRRRGRKSSLWSMSMACG